MRQHQGLQTLKSGSSPNGEVPGSGFARRSWCRNDEFQALVVLFGWTFKSVFFGEYLMYLQSHSKSFKISSDPLKRIWIRGSNLIASLSKLLK